LEFKKESYVISNMPIECDKETREYLEDSDEFYSWFSSKYEYTNDKVKPIIIKDLYNSVFKIDDYYLKKTRKEQNELTCKEFSKLIKNNIFLKEHFKTECEFEGIRYKSSLLKNYKEIEEQ